MSDAISQKIVRSTRKSVAGSSTAVILHDISRTSVKCRKPLDVLLTQPWPRRRPVARCTTVPNTFAKRGGGNGRTNSGSGLGLLGEFDTNRDGTVSADEFAAARTSLVTGAVNDLFGKYDTNNDSLITTAEALAIFELATLLSQYDGNNDGNISKAEATAAVRDVVNDQIDALLARYDLNHDGEVTTAEVAAVDGRHHRRGH